MGYTLINYDEVIEVHSDMCDEVFDKKDNFEFNNKAQYLNFALFEEVEEFLKKEDSENKIVFCDKCKPESREYDEEYDDFYEEFDDEEEEIGDSCCII